MDSIRRNSFRHLFIGQVQKKRPDLDPEKIALGVTRTLKKVSTEEMTITLREMNTSWNSVIDEYAKTRSKSVQTKIFKTRLAASMGVTYSYVSDILSPKDLRDLDALTERLSA